MHVGIIIIDKQNGAWKRRRTPTEFALHRQYLGGVRFIHAQSEEARLHFKDDFGIGECLEYRTTSFDVAGVDLPAPNELNTRMFRGLSIRREVAA